jgi:hypothetical protein
MFIVFKIVITMSLSTSFERLLQACNAKEMYRVHKSLLFGLLAAHRQAAHTFLQAVESCLHFTSVQVL